MLQGLYEQLLNENKNGCINGSKSVAAPINSPSRLWHIFRTQNAIFPRFESQNI